MYSRLNETDMRCHCLWQCLYTGDKTMCHIPSPSYRQRVEKFVRFVDISA